MTDGGMSTCVAVPPSYAPPFSLRNVPFLGTDVFAQGADQGV
jgi:hypothetical protein